MRNGIELVEILDFLLEKKGISRRQFCSQIDIPPSTIAAWKHKNILPNTELICKVADFLNVSIDWLVNGEDPKTEISIVSISRHTIMDRIETILRQNTNSFDTPLAELYTEHLGKVADFDLINNWSLGRINVPESIITSIAKELKVTTDWLLTGKEETDQVIDTYLYKLAKEHEGFLKGFDCLDEEKQKAVSKEIADSLELRRLQREAKLKK
ncbi:helix-turn-helix transcriptional regulator [Treponema sp.]|uniref:helix-turn-helix domain-containing protein n=1 Tax=Treponema sp. TaxID=166 RepID=UPI00298EBA97|nr:helix-turn-helix transcriptional regulator [Treponema sp.]MCQ2241221.1 helix-turn-helix domain-containing protein [Treponema sp.]